STASVHALGNATTINSGGTIKLGGTGGDQIYTGITVSNAAGGILDMAGLNEGFSMLTGSGVVTNSGSATSTLQLGEGNTTGIFSGQIKDGANGKIALAKVNTGTLTLSGANTYSGNTTINALGGILALGAGGSINNSAAISIAAGGTFNVTAVTPFTLSASTTLNASGTGTTVGTTAAAIAGSST